MVELAPDVRALLAQAQRVAQRLGARTSTGHLVLAMLESQGDTGHVLEGHGARAVALYEALKQVEREADNAIELCLERARRIAVHSGSRQARPLHVLLSALQNARNEAHRGLAALGVPVEVLRQTLEDSLGLRSKVPTTAGLREPREAPARIAADALKPLPRTLIDWEAQKRVQSGTAARA